MIYDWKFILGNRIVNDSLPPRLTGPLSGRVRAAYEQKVETKEIGGIKKLGLSASFKFFL